jgi:hypothetical protein
MLNLGKEINGAACSLATEILNCTELHGKKRDDLGLVLERSLKQFAESILKAAEAKGAVFS